MRSAMNSNNVNTRASPNPRFASVRSKLDTGHNMRKVMAAFEGTSGPNAHKKRKDEFFTRLRPSTLGMLIQPLVESEESIYRLDKDDTASVVSSVVPNDSGAAPAAASAGVGNLLILDCRTFEAYTKCHVYGAVHYDVAMLSRATNNFPREVYYFRGPIECDKMVVLYDEDGKTGAALGNKFVEMGIENTYVLHGGFLGACAACPAALTGAPPEAEELAEMMARAGLKRSKGTRGLGSAAGGSVARCSTAGSTCTQNTKLSVASSSFAGRSHWK